MHTFSKTEQELLIKLDLKEMTPTQVRLLKSITSLMTNVVSADEEAEFFDSSSELFKKVAELVRHADFAEANKNIKYGEQAVEFSIDNLNDTLDTKSLHNIDN